MKGKLTDNQRDVLAAIKAYIKTNKRPPTHSDICELMGYRSDNGASSHLKALQKKGYISVEPKTARGIIVL